MNCTVGLTNSTCLKGAGLGSCFILSFHARVLNVSVQRTTDMYKSRLWTQMCTPMANHKTSLRCRRDQRWKNFVNKFNNGGVNTNDAFSTQDCLNLF